MSTHGHSTRDRIVDALMELAAEQDWDRIEITEIAEREIGRASCRERVLCVV